MNLNYNVTYKEIGDFVNKKEPTLKSMKNNNPEQLELLTIGALSKKYNLNIDDIKLLIYFKESLSKEK